MNIDNSPILSLNYSEIIRNSKFFKLAILILGFLIVSIIFLLYAYWYPPSKSIDSFGSIDLLKKYPLIDGHNDLPWRIRQLTNNNISMISLNQTDPHLLQTDWFRLKNGLIRGEFWSAYIRCPSVNQTKTPFEMTIEQVDLIHRLSMEYKNVLTMVRTKEEAEEVFRNNQTVASFIGIEGGHSIENNLSFLRILHSLGCRYMSLTHICSTDWAESERDPNPNIPNGLSDFGIEVVHQMNQLGMLIDLSHTSERTMNRVLDVTLSPVIFSHSNVRSLCNHTRNVPDSVLLRLKENNGIVMVSFYPVLLNNQAVEMRSKTNLSQFQEWLDTSSEAPTIETIVNHIDYLKNLIGVEYIGIGSDYDGVGGLHLKDLEDVSKYPKLVDCLIQRGYSERELELIFSENILRVLDRNRIISESF